MYVHDNKYGHVYADKNQQYPMPTDLFKGMMGKHITCLAQSNMPLAN